MLEKFMEDLIWKFPDDFFPRHALKPVARQFSLSGAGRLDISFRDAQGRLWVIEVKAVAMRLETADQVSRYADELKKRYPSESIIPAVVAPTIGPTCQSLFDKWGIEHFEISEAAFRRVASERGVELDIQEAEPHHRLNTKPLSKHRTVTVRSAAYEWISVAMAYDGWVHPTKNHGGSNERPWDSPTCWASNGELLCGKFMGNKTDLRTHTNYLPVSEPVSRACRRCEARRAKA